MLKKYSKKINWILIAGVAAVVLFVFSNYFFGKYQLSFLNMMYDMPPWNSLGAVTDGPSLSDVADSFLPSVQTTLLDGTFSGLWDPQVGLGAPADLSIAMYPLNYLYFLPLGAAMLLRAIAEFVIAFLGMYLLMKAFGCRKPVAAIAGVSYCFSSVLVMWLGWQHSDVAAFAPLAFFFFERFLTERKVKYCLGLTVTAYLMLVAGMPTYAVYFLYFLAAYVLFRTAWVCRKQKKRILQVYGFTLGSVVLAGLAALPYLMHLLTTVGSNGYAGSRLEQASRTLDLSYLQSLFLPYLRETGGVHLNESTVFVGLVAVALLAFTWVRFREKGRMVFWTVSLAVVFLLVFTHALDGIFVHIPIVNSSLKIRLLALLNFTMVVLAGLNLNDIVENREAYCRHRLRTCLAGLAGMGLLAAGFLAKYFVYDNQGYTEELTAYLVTALCIGACLLLFFVRRIHSNLILGALCVVTVINSGSFAKEYLPWTEKGAELLPSATDTIRFLQEHTDDERVAAVGAWILFPNTYVFYGLEDVRAHNFVMTNSDIVQYYETMTEDGFTTRTRFAIVNTANSNLLKYLGVKYVILDYQMSDADMPVGPVSEKNSVRDVLVPEEDSMRALAFMVGTYMQEYQEGDLCYLTIEDSDGTVVWDGQYDMTEFRDNCAYVAEIDGSGLKQGEEYTVTLTTNTPEDRPVAFYVYETEGEGQLAINGETTDLELALRPINGDIVYAGEDQIVTTEFDEYSDRVELADSVRIGTEEEILDEMSEAFEKNTVFYTEEEAAGLTSAEYEPLTENEYAEIADRTDDSVTVEVHTESEKILMLNEYYDSDWKVYVNGEEQKLRKSNYLFRSVEVPAGDSVVEFRYEPRTIQGMYVVSGASWGVTLLLAAFSGRIQRKLDAEKGKTHSR